MWGSGGSGLFKGLIAALCIISTISLALVYFIPSPPSKVVMATAFKGASFEYYGRQYREVFARYHVDLELRETAGAVENVKLLQDPKSDVQIAFTTGGVSDAKRAPDVLSLGTVYTQPFWIFYSSNEPLDRLAQLKGKLRRNICPQHLLERSGPLSANSGHAASATPWEQVRRCEF
ncbi:MAG: hypothetical protein WCB47_24085 [Pseudolabrys sp.]